MLTMVEKLNLVHKICCSRW